MRLLGIMAGLWTLEAALLAGPEEALYLEPTPRSGCRIKPVCNAVLWPREPERATALWAGAEGVVTGETPLRQRIVVPLLEQRSAAHTITPHSPSDNWEQSPRNAYSIIRREDLYKGNTF